MKYKLIKDYTRPQGEGAVKTFKKGALIDVGRDKAKQLMAEGFIESEAEPVKPKFKKPRRKKWIAEDNNEQNED